MPAIRTHGVLLHGQYRVNHEGPAQRQTCVGRAGRRSALAAIDLEGAESIATEAKSLSSAIAQSDKRFTSRHQALTSVEMSTEFERCGYCVVLSQCIAGEPSIGKKYRPAL
jgi:hypothetical protein